LQKCQYYTIIVRNKEEVKMDVVKTFGRIVSSSIGKPHITRNLIKLGLCYEYVNKTLFPNKNTSKAYRYLNRICLKFVLSALFRSEKSAWVNLFAPAELLLAMDIHPLFIEGFSNFLTGMHCEHTFIDAAENAGIAETLCSYHKAFIGAVETNVLTRPKFILASTIICDPNLNTFRHISRKYNVPLYLLDVPYKYSEESERYLVSQLTEAINMMEDIAGKKLDYNRLKEIIKKENKTRAYINRYLKSLKEGYVPSTLTLQLFMLFTSHVFIGRDESLKFYKMLCDEIRSYPNENTIRIFWVHLMPFYYEALVKYFNYNPDYSILGYDLNFDYLDEMDFNNPLQALAKKMILNTLNGDFKRKADFILDMVEKLKPDGVINFCHWGCKQSSGGAMILKKRLKEKNIPFLSIDGDLVDRRNAHEAQVRTRLEAFFEAIKSEKQRVIS
jgi:benzoyl-CoA reductase/2-hydroxyglutaryl-CoA dehydratase subunit BcrC/BadD/HgdB